MRKSKWIIGLLFLSQFLFAASVVRGPYLQLRTEKSMVVRWRTDAPTNSRVQYGEVQGNLTLSASDATSTTEHEVRLIGLSPDTKYFYNVGSSPAVQAGGDATHFFLTAPSPGTSKPTRIWIQGDSGTPWTDPRDAYYAFTGSIYTDLMLMLGDNAYQDGTDPEFQSYLFEKFDSLLRQTVLWPSRGNHDRSDPDAGTGTYFDVFTLPEAAEAGGKPSETEAYYSFDHGNIHFIVLESHRSTFYKGSAPTPMKTWLAQDLASYAGKNYWLVAYFHFPPYSQGDYNSDNPNQERAMREYVVPILEQGGIDLVLGGHSHNYQRSMLIDGHYGLSNTFDNTMVVDGGDGRENGDGAYQKSPGPHNGAIYVVCGVSGYARKGGKHPIMVAGFNQEGSIVLDVDGNRMDFKHINNNGNILDRFTFIKNFPSTAKANQPGTPRINLMVSPNPFHSSTRISFPDLMGQDGKFTIVDQKGAVVKTFSITGKSRALIWNTRGFASGMYVLSGVIDGRRISRKLLIAH